MIKKIKKIINYKPNTIEEIFATQDTFKVPLPNADMTDFISIWYKAIYNEDLNFRNIK